jgi:polar amino acid transport system substrate-binding protein
MKSKFSQIVLLVLVLLVIVSGCQAAPDLNRPWHTATPQFAVDAVAKSPTAKPTTAAVPTATPQPTAAASAGSVATAAPTATSPAISGAVLQIAGAEDNPPFMYADAKGNPTGLYPVLINAIFKRMGMNINIKTYPWNRALAMGTNGEAPLAGIYKNEERLKIFDYSDAIYPNKILIYVLKGKSFKFASPSDLAGQNIGVMSGWTYGDAFDQAKAAGKFTTEEVANDADNFQKLVLGRVGCIFAESTIADQIIRDQNYGDKVEVLPTPVIVFDAYMVFAKKLNQGDLLKTFNATLAAMKQDGSYDKLVADWSGK